MKPIKVFLVLSGVMILVANNALATTSSQILVMSNQLYQIAKDLTTGIFPTSILLIAIGMWGLVNAFGKSVGDGIHQLTNIVYDTITGNYLLIPQGAKLVGEYNSNLTFGQKRVQVVWNRIIFPDGASLDLQKMQGVDMAGYTGFQDKVDNHYLRIYGNAVLLSLMGAGYDILNQKAQQSTDLRETVAASVGQKLSDVGGQTLQKNMDVQPTLIIDPGYKFKIMVMKDIVLENLENAEGALSYTK